MLLKILAMEDDSIINNIVDAVIEEKLLDIAKVLGSSMEGCLGDLQNFIKEMLAEEKGKGKQQEVSKSSKKSRTQRELEKLASSINYDHHTGDKEFEVKLLGM